MANGSRLPRVISTLWLQAMILTFLFSFAMLGYLFLSFGIDPLAGADGYGLAVGCIDAQPRFRDTRSARGLGRFRE